MNDKDYHNQEMIQLNAQLAAVECAPLADRKENAKEWAEALKTPDLVAERVGWLLNGSYGYGAYVRAKEIARAKRGNRAAQAAQLIAAMEWGTPVDMVTKAWKELNTIHQELLKAAILAVLDQWVADPENKEA